MQLRDPSERRGLAGVPEGLVSAPAPAWEEKVAEDRATTRVWRPTRREPSLRRRGLRADAAASPGLLLPSRDDLTRPCYRRLGQRACAGADASCVIDRY